jgi:hypothetical protein
MKNLLSATVAVAVAASLSTGAALAQNEHMTTGNMMDNGWMGGYGHYWWTVLVAVAVGVVVWILLKRRK